jgi:uncharacterized protein YqjF (DUF2071 family)
VDLSATAALLRKRAEGILFLRGALLRLRPARRRLAIHSLLAALHSLLSGSALTLVALRKWQLIVLLTILLPHLPIVLLIVLLAWLLARNNLLVRHLLILLGWAKPELCQFVSGKLTHAII